MVTFEQRVERVDAALPQTQCQQCGYPRCKEYALALAQGHTEINRCPPGGDETIVRLSQLLNTQILALDVSLGEHRPATVAHIREHECIGCTLCMQVCPTDAIIGAAKLMHTVISVDCTGCELCLPVCPVDCIDTPAASDETDSTTPTLAHSTTTLSDKAPEFNYYSREQVAHYRTLTERRIARLGADGSGPGGANNQPQDQGEGASGTDRAVIRQDIAAAVARRRAQRTAD